MKIPNHLDWDLLRKFNMCSRHKSFAEAAKEANIQPPAFGNQMKRLETAIGFELFERSNGIMVNRFTNKGADLLKTSCKTEDFLYRKQGDNVLQHDEELKIYTTHGIASSILPDIVSYFCDLYPNIKIILLTQHPPKFLAQDESVIRSDFIEQKNVEKIKIIDIEMGFYASINYVKKFGNPDTFEHFSKHRYLFSFGNRQIDNLGPENTYLSSSIISSNIEFSYKMCLKDQGIVELPTIYPGVEKLVKVLNGVKIISHTLYLAYIENQKADSPNVLFSKILKKYKKEKKL